ncbi:MAG: T9SS type A sorting domain-containing protein [Chitinophagales bacterium]|nr:T9SS type A sorting domain-containing protein [Chitinophagales bacterium]
MKTTILYLLFQFFAFQVTYAQTWLPLGEGVDNGGGFGGYVNTVAFDSIHNYLYVGGNFSYAGSNPANSIAIWDGLNWISLDINYYGDYSSFLNYHDTILVADLSGRILKVYEETIVDQLPSLKGSIGTLLIYNNDLYACGDFSADYEDHILNNIARWDGKTWISLGGGITSGYVNTMCVYNGNLVVGGRFNIAGDRPVNNIATWNGKQWSSLDSGITDSRSQADVNALAVFQGELYVGGSFDSAGAFYNEDIAKWNGNEWSSVGDKPIMGYILCFTLKDSSLYVGGAFESIGKRTARWDGNQWFDLDLTSSGFVKVLGSNKVDLIAGGSFTYGTNGIRLNNIAQYTTVTNINGFVKCSGFYIYPNPATDQLHIEAPKIHNATVTLLNLFGQVVLQQQISDNATIDISTLARGMYLVNILDESGDVVQKGKVVKE